MPLSAREDLIRRKFRSLENTLQKVDPVEFARVCHAYMLFLQDQQALPKDIESPPRQYQRRHQFLGAGFSEWALEFLLRETFRVKTHLKPKIDCTRWDSIASLVNAGNRISQALYKPHTDPTLHMNSVLYQQIPWQRGASNQQATRYWRIFSFDSVDEIVREVHGISTVEVVRLAYALIGALTESFELPRNLEFRGINVDQERGDAFVERMTVSIDQIRSHLETVRTFDERMLYGVSPFLLHPLLLLSDGGPVICPIPNFLFRRALEGLYYDCFESVRTTPGEFGARLGRSFESYIYDLLNRFSEQRNSSVYGSIRYGTRARPKDTIDFFWETAGQSIIIECKAKRMALAARLPNSTLAQRQSELDYVIGAIVQLFRTVQDAKLERFESPIDLSQRVLGLVVTLEEWIILGPTMKQYIEDKVAQTLADLEIPRDVVERVDYRIISASDFEPTAYWTTKFESAELLTDLFGEQRWHQPSNMIIDRYRQKSADYQNPFERELDTALS